MLRSSLALVVVTPLFLACTEQSASPAPAEQPAAVAPPASQPATAAAAPGKGESPADREQVDDDGVVRRGEALTAGEPLPVGDALAKAKELDGKSVKVTGVVDQVCAKKGCWFALRAEDEAHKGQTIRITSKDYRFFMPKSSVGQVATIEGDFKVATLSQEEAQHLEDDAAEAAGGAAKRVEGERVEVQIAAVGVQMRPSDG